MLTLSEHDDAGFTLAEILIVIALVALFAVMVIPSMSSLKRTTLSPEAQLQHWLSNRHDDVLLSSIPEKICLTGNRIDVYLYSGQKWQPQNMTFEPPSGAGLDAECQDTDENQGRCCFMVSPDAFSPDGKIILSAHGQQFIYQWGTPPSRR